MKSKSYINHIFIFLAIILLSSCSNDKPINADYSFKVAKDVEQSIHDFQKVKFNTDKNLDLGFYKGKVWIKLEISSGKRPISYVVLCNDLINRNYKFYKLDSIQGLFKPFIKKDNKKYDHRSFSFAKPNFKIDLEPNEQSTFLITTSSDGRILQASPQLISLEEFQSIKQQTLIFDIVFYFFMTLLLMINLFYFRLIRRGIYYYYAAYILSGCLMYLFVEGRLYGLGISNSIIDHLMFISIRLWVLSSVLFILNFLETQKTNPNYYKLIIILLSASLGGTTFYQFIFYNTSISLLHKFENITGFVWIILTLITISVSFKARKKLSTYYLIPYSIFLLFVTLGLIDSHTTILPGDPFSYFKIGTILEFLGFTYFIALLIKQKFIINESLENELSKHQTLLKEKKLASNISLVSVLKLIENSFINDSDWNDFKQKFEELNPFFFKNLIEKHSDLSKSELRLLTLLRIGYSQKEIATMLNIAPDSVKKARSRVRKKISIDKNQDLNIYLQHF